MNKAVYSLSGLEPLVFGDARPFAAAAGARARSTLEMPNPSTLYGALVRALFRDRLESGDPKLAQDTRRRLCDFLLHGPFLLVDGRVAFPTPACWLPARGPQGKVIALPLLPGTSSEGANWPAGVAAGLVPPEIGPDERTKEALPQRVPMDDLSRLLYPAPGARVEPAQALPNPPRQRSSHVAIDPGSGKARQGQLYSAEGVRFQTALLGDRRHSFEVLFAVESPFDDELPERIELTLGGERRNAVAHRLGESDERLAPADQTPTETARVLLVLATPAAFEEGWMPGWLKNDLPCPNVGVRFRLVSAAVPGFEAVSGWGQTDRNFGPKPAVWLAPAGSAYFLEAVGPSGPLAGDALSDLRRRLAEAWLKPVSDSSKFRRKGFGAALWGSWTPVA
ncbi:MAG: type III-B CRISPR module-associated Cmr3 family protein [Fimbriimonadaceae bacterium]